MVQPEVVFIQRSLRPSCESFASTRTPRCRHVPSVPPRNLRPGLEAQTRKPSTRWFLDSKPTKLSASSILHTRPPPLNACHRRRRSVGHQVLQSPARFTRLPSLLDQHGHSSVYTYACQCPQMSATVAGHSASWSLSPSLMYVLHRSGPSAWHVPT